MTRALLILVVGLLAAAPPARSQPPDGIVRPTPAEERGMSELELGAQLFAGNCSTCHGSDARGLAPGRGPAGAGNVRGAGPSLHGVGALAADFYLGTGYMPLGRPGEQPERRRVPFDRRELRALVSFVASLGDGPAVPTVHVADGDLGRGRALFTQHCAGCHQVVAQGGTVTGARVPPLDRATATQVAEAIRVGPYLMPRFTRHQLSDADVADIARYVEWTHHPDDAGGWGLGNLGPFPEGMVTWLVAVVALIAACVVVSRRSTA
jgi:ubiquinol-cytochrome c reductase cytochrome c subunit